MDTFNLKVIYDFLKELKSNNNRDWFNSNKSKYLNAKTEFEKFVKILIELTQDIDSSIHKLEPKQCIFRIYNDVRFSKNKEPYKTHFGAVIANGGRKSSFAGYYFHIEPGGSIIGGGIYQPPADILKSIRTNIYNDSSSLKKILNQKDFKSIFGGIYGEKLKTHPRGFDKDFEDIDLIRHKHYAVIKEIEDDFWFDENLLKNISHIIKIQYKFNNYLNSIIEKQISNINKNTLSSKAEEEFIKNNFGL